MNYDFIGPHKERKAIRMALRSLRDVLPTHMESNQFKAREGDMLVTPCEPLRAMLGVADTQHLRVREGDTPSAWRVALADSS